MANNQLNGGIGVIITRLSAYIGSGKGRTGIWSSQGYYRWKTGKSLCNLIFCFELYNIYLVLDRTCVAKAVLPKIDLK